MSKPLREIMELIDSIGNLSGSTVRKEAEVQYVHLQMLRYLSRCNRFSDTPSAITGYLGLTKGTISQSIKIMERSGYISRVQDSEDKRLVHLRLSGKGKKLLEKFNPHAGWLDAGNQMQPAVLQNAVSALRTLLFHYQKNNGFRTFGQCRSCRHLVVENMHYRCGLTNAPLSDEDTLKICVEHDYANDDLV